MTRLRTTDIENVGKRLPEHDKYLQSVVGLSLAAVACKAAACTFEVNNLSATFCVVPISAGKGVIPGFSETVCDILLHIGFEATVSPVSDSKGLAYARESGARTIMWADDRRFVAELSDGEMIDNTEATALGYVTGLDLMAKGLSDRSVLLLGCGKLGHAVADPLLAMGCRVTAFDPVKERAKALAGQTRVKVAHSLEQALMDHDLIIDASDSAAVIHDRHVSDATLVAGPGMPCGITPEAMKQLSDRFLHDPLQIGVATMAMLAHKRCMQDVKQTL